MGQRKASQTCCYFVICSLDLEPSCVSWSLYRRMRGIYDSCDKVSGCSKRPEDQKQIEK